MFARSTVGEPKQWDDVRLRARANVQLHTSLLQFVVRLCCDDHVLDTHSYYLFRKINNVINCRSWQFTQCSTCGTNGRCNKARTIHNDMMNGSSNTTTTTIDCICHRTLTYLCLQRPLHIKRIWMQQWTPLPTKVPPTTTTVPQSLYLLCKF